ncbi:MAG: hypothetical protein GKS06_00770 [Acidobacteria bacterium]|nr:hypothetical protein [Acidobacteriota bacterium]
MPETETFVSKIFIAGSIDAVWREITKTDEPQGAMFNNRMHTDGLALGGQIRMRTPDGKYTGVIGEILEFDPPHRFAHTFRFTHLEDAECVVSYDLKEVDGGVEFTLTSKGVAVGSKTAKQMKSGGGFICKTLKAIVEKGRLPLHVWTIYHVLKALSFMAPAATKSENWPLKGNGDAQPA